GQLRCRRRPDPRLLRRALPGRRRRAARPAPGQRRPHRPHQAARADPHGVPPARRPRGGPLRGRVRVARRAVARRAPGRRAYPGSVSTHRDPASPWVFSTRELGRRAGVMRAFHRDVPAPGDDHLMGLDVLAVPPGATITLDVRLEAVSEGVYVSGTASAPLAGECVRCLDDLTDHVTVELGELFAYPDSVTDETTDDD